MTSWNTPRGFAIAFFAQALLALPATAELKMLEDKGWLGCFTGYENRRFDFKMTTEGKVKILAMGKAGKTIGEQSAIMVDFIVQETLPDGKVVTKTLQPMSLESPQAPAVNPKEVTITGKTTGDAEVQIKLEQNRDVIAMGGKLLSPGTLKNPVKFGVKITFPDAYVHVTDKVSAKGIKEFEKRTEKDRVQIKWTDGKGRKVNPSDKYDAASAELNGPGISTFNAEFSTFGERRFEFVATPNSAMTLSNKTISPLNEGFSIIWMADVSKDPEGKARVQMEIR